MTFEQDEKSLAYATLLRDFRRAIAEFITTHGITHEELQKRLNISRDVYEDLLSPNTWISVGELADIAAALGARWAVTLEKLP